MRLLNIHEQHQISGGYLEDNDTEFWIYVYGLPPAQRNEIINTSMLMHSVFLFAITGALGAMAVVEFISNSTWALGGSAVLGTLSGGALGYSFGKSIELA